MKAAFGLSATVAAIAAIPALAYRVGGDLVTLIHTDAGLTGIGRVTPRCSASRANWSAPTPLMQSLSRAVQSRRNIQSHRQRRKPRDRAVGLVGKMLEIPLRCCGAELMAVHALCEPVVHGTPKGARMARPCAPRTARDQVPVTFSR
jgi:hypothetical protein